MSSSLFPSDSDVTRRLGNAYAVCYLGPTVVGGGDLGRVVILGSGPLCERP